MQIWKLWVCRVGAIRPGMCEMARDARGRSRSRAEPRSPKDPQPLRILFLREKEPVKQTEKDFPAGEGAFQEEGSDQHWTSWDPSL